MTRMRVETSIKTISGLYRQGFKLPKNYTLEIDSKSSHERLLKDLGPRDSFNHIRHET